MRSLISLVLLTVTMAPAYACQTNGKGVLLGGTVAMHLSAGETCEFVFAPPGSSFGLGGTATTRGGFVMVKNLRIATRAMHGQAGRAGLNSIAYKASSTYHGSDGFEVEVEMERHTITVPVVVTVN